MKSIENSKIRPLCSHADWLSRLRKDAKKRRHRQLQRRQISGQWSQTQKHRTGCDLYQYQAIPGVEEVKALLSAYLDKESVRSFSSL